MKITDINLVEILTTQGTSGVKAFIKLENNYVFEGSVGHGTSRGNYEAAVYGKTEEIEEGSKLFSNFQLELDEKADILYVAIVGKEANFAEIDQLLCDLDGTADKSNIGGAIILSISIAVARAQAYVEEIEVGELLGKKIWGDDAKLVLPTPLINIINGGMHVTGQIIPFQEILLCPEETKKNGSVGKIISNAQTIFFELQKLLKKKSIFYGYGFEGGISAQFNSVDQALDLLYESIMISGFVDDFYIGFDCAATNWFDQKTGKYSFSAQGKKYTSQQLMSWYLDLKSRYPIVYFEDPFAEDDFAAWTMFKKEYSGHIAGDDLCATQVARLEKVLQEDCINTVIVKPTQIGTLSETIDFIKYAQEKKLEMVISHRSCETDDGFIIDLIFAAGSRFCKLGNITQGSIVKYNKLLEYNFMLIMSLLKSMENTSEVEEFTTTKASEEMREKEEENNI